MTRIILIVLFTDRQQIIATNRQQPFFIKEDLKRFRSITLGHTVVMGRKTYEAIGKPLAKRKNIILTTSLPRQEGLVIARSMEDLKVILQSESKVYIIGGGQIYQQFFSTATAIEVTRVYAPIEGENSISFPIYFTW